MSKISWLVICVIVNTNPYKQNDECHNANDGENCAHEITSTREYDPNEDDFDPQKTTMTQRNVMMDFGGGWKGGKWKVHPILIQRRSIHWRCELKHACIEGRLKGRIISKTLNCKSYMYTHFVNICGFFLTNPKGLW